MEVDELQRRQLFNDLDRAIGPDSAAVLMTYLPPAGWSDLATKSDLDIGRSETKAEFATVRQELASLRTETKAEFASVRQELDVLRTETKAEFASVRQELDVLRTETKAEFASVRQDLASLRTETKAEFESLRVTMAQGFEIVGKSVTADLRKEMVELTHRLYFGMAGVFVGVGTLAAGAAALFR